MRKVKSNTFKKKRQWRRKKPLVIFYTFLSVVVLASIIAGSFYLYYKNLQYISPLPKTGLFAFARNVKQSQTQLELLLEQSKIPVVSVVESSNSAYLIELKEGELITMTGKKDFQKQISSLQRIIDRFTIEGKKISRLDLRFDRPIVVVR